MRRVIQRGVRFALLGAMSWVAVAATAVSPARADDEAWKEFKGQVVISDVLLASSFGSDQVMITSLNRVRRSAVGAVEGFWRLHCIAFLQGGVEGDTLVVSARDVTSAQDRHDARRGTAKAVRVFEAPIQPDQKILQLNDFVLTEAMGFQRGHHYELAVEKSPDTGGKPDVYARGVVTLR
jgi:hypothetical protein